MNRIATIARAELSEKWLVFPAALLIGGFPLALARLRPGGTPSDVRGTAAILLAGLAGGALAVTLGFWSTAGDIASRRAAFYLVRPLTSFELWAGKLAGGLLMVFGATAIALVPAALAGGSFRGWNRPPTPVLDAILPSHIGPAGLGLGAAAALAILFLVAQAAGIAALARSPRLFADALVALGGAFLVSGAVRRLLLARADSPAAAGLTVVAAVLAAALGVGCYRAMKEGGIDARRADRAQARVFAAAIAVSAAGFLLFAAWVLRPSPADLRSVDWIVPSPRGDWIGIFGRARGHEPAFLVDIKTGEYLRLGFARQRLPVISANGAAAAWTSSDPGFPESSVTPHTVSLAGGRHRAVAWETKDLRADPILVFSSDARRFAIVAPDRIVVWDAVGGGMLAAATPPRPLWEEARGFTCATFAGEDRLRIYSARRAASDPATTIEIFELDVAARRLRSTGTAGPFRRAFPILASPDRSRILLRDETATVHLLDAVTGETLATFSGGGATFRSATFLSDGRIGLFESGGAVARLRVLSPGGAETGAFPVGGAERAWLLGEPRKGALMLATASAQPRAVLVVDLATGHVERWANGLRPAAPYAATLSGDPGALSAPGGLETRLFFDSRFALVELEGPNRVRRLFPRH